MHAPTTCHAIIQAQTDNVIIRSAYATKRAHDGSLRPRQSHLDRVLVLDEMVEKSASFLQAACTPFPQLRAHAQCMRSTETVVARRHAPSSVSTQCSISKEAQSIRVARYQPFRLPEACDRGDRGGRPRVRRSRATPSSSSAAAPATDPVASWASSVTSPPSVEGGDVRRRLVPCVEVPLLTA